MRIFKFWLVSITSLVLNVTFFCSSFAQNNGNIKFLSLIHGNKEEYLRSICNTSDGNLLISFYTNSTSGNFDTQIVESYEFYGVIIKISPEGVILWQKHFYPGGGDMISNIIERNSNEYIFTTIRFTQDDLFPSWHLVTLNLSGEIVNSKPLENGAGKNLLLLNDGRLITHGKDENSIRVYNSDGTINKPSSFFNFPYFSGWWEINKIVQVSDEFLVCVGEKSGYYSNDDCWLAKLNLNSGNIEWQKTFGSTSDDEISDVFMDPEGSLIALAKVSRGDSFFSNSYYKSTSLFQDSFNMAFLEINPHNGNIIKKRCYSGYSNYSNAFCGAIRPINSKRFLFSGGLKGDGGDAIAHPSNQTFQVNPWIFSIDNLGNINWQVRFGEPDVYEEIGEIEIKSNNQVFVATSLFDSNDIKLYLIDSIPSANPCSSLVEHSGNIDSYTGISAMNINSSVSLNFNTNLIYNAQGFIELKPGFVASNSSVFIAEIKDCD
ncbi:MAG: hypothetical protein LCH67_17305 [Bacteroidetes bacterium]|nr:hypothetical protein [Bacteroidota bacterium]